MPYDAFVSYSHAVDSSLAPAIQTALHRLARPWYRVRALHVFRDVTNLSAAPELWPMIERALDDSAALILLASPEAASSKWVRREVEHWRAKAISGPIYIVLTEGVIEWDETRDDFHREHSTAIPPTLYGVFQKEPLWVDMRWVRADRKDLDLSVKNAMFADRVATIAAPLHGKKKEDIVGEDVKQRRIIRTLATATMTALLVLLATVAGALWYAKDQLANAQRSLANALATAALTTNDRRDAALLTAVAATRIAPTATSRASLLQLLQRHRQTVRFLYPPDQLSNVVTLAVSRGGQVAAGTYNHSVEWWNLAGERRNLMIAGTHTVIAFAGEELLGLQADDESVTLLSTGKAETFRRLGHPLESGPAMPAPLFVANRSGETIAFAIAASGAEPVEIGVCARRPVFSCRLFTRDQQPRGIALSADGAHIALAWCRDDAGRRRCLGGVELVRTTDFAPVTESPLDEEPVAVESEGSHFTIWLASGRRIVMPTNPDGDLAPLAIPTPQFSAGLIAATAGNFAAFADALEGVGVPNVESMIAVLDRSLPPNGVLSRIYPASSGVIAIGKGGRVATRTCDSAGECGISVGSVRLGRSAGEVTAVAFTPDATRLIAGGSDGHVLTWNANSGAVDAERQIGRRVDTIDCVSDARALIRSGTHVEIVDPGTLTAVKSADLAGADQIVLTSTGRLFFSRNSQAFEDDLTRGKESSRTVSPDTLPKWSDGDDHEVSVLAVSRDGTFLATVANAGGEGVSPNIVLSNISGRNAPPLLIPTDHGVVVALSVGTTFVVAAMGERIRLWDRATGAPASLPFVAAGAVSRIDLLTDDSLLAVYYSDGRAETITLGVADLQHFACDLVNRDLTADEWRGRLSGIDYEKPCETILRRPLDRRW
jgi:hypothetical protein